jgi:molybdate transport system ATP-binding protein
VAEHAVLDELRLTGPGLTLITGPNGSGKSAAARSRTERGAGAWILSAESQQAFYEAQLAADEGNFKQGVDTSSRVRELLGGERGRGHPLFAAFRLEGLWDRGFRQLSTGEARKVLLLQAVLAAPTLLVLDDPFDGLDRAAGAELASAVVRVAEQLPVVVVVGAFPAGELPFPAEALHEVVEFTNHRVAFRGSAEAFLGRGGDERRHRHAPPPVEMGGWYPPLAPEVPLVQLVDGCVRYGEQTVFAHLDFTVRPGQHTLIEGPNGSGKSSLLELLTGDHPQAYSNDLKLFGRRRGSGETVWDIKKNVGLVSARLHRDYRVGGSLEEVLLSGLFDSIGLYQHPEPSDRARARAWLEWLQLGREPAAAFRELSFGQQRLVLIARAAIKVPPLVVMDEPTSGLDAHNRRRVHDLIASLCTQQRSTVLMVTHRADERTWWREHIGDAILSLR